MSIFEFIHLHIDTKADAVFAGTLVACRVEKERTYQLYYLGSFYVEALFYPKENRINGFKPFTCQILLEPYLNQFNLYDFY